MAYSKHEDLRNRITAAVARVGRDTLTRVWNVMDYRIDVCRFTKGVCICQICKEKTWRVSLSIGVRITMIQCVVYLLRIFKMFHGLMNNPLCPQAGRNNYLRQQHHWLLLAMTEHTGNAPKPDDDPLVTALRSLTFPVDSHVTLAYRGSGVDQVVLQELYNTRQGQPLVFTPPLVWSPGQLLPPKLKRDNYGGVSIKAATVASSSKFGTVIAQTKSS
jgi:hypothetical protein